MTRRKAKRRDVRTCERKQEHAARADAEAHLISMKLEWGARGLTVYRCPVHPPGKPRHWHVGHRR